MRTEKKFNKVVNYDKGSGGITVLEYIFKHTDGFKGATGSKFEAVTKERHDEIINMDEDELADYLIDSGFELPKQHEKGGYLEWAEQFYDEDKLNLFFDLSYSESWDYIREECKLSKDEAYIFSCIGGGRCFDKDFKGNVNTKLSKLIREAETK